MSEDELKDSEQPLVINQESNNPTLADGIDPTKDERYDWINYIFEGNLEEINNKIYQTTDSMIMSLLPDEEKKRLEEEKKKLEEEREEMFDVVLKIYLDWAAKLFGGEDSPKYQAILDKFSEELPFKSNSAKGISRFFTTDDFYRLRNTEQREEMLYVMECILKKMTTAGNDAAHEFNRRAKEFAVKLAAERWKMDTHTTKDEMAEYIQGHIEEEFKNEIEQNKSKVPELATIKNWITEVVPPERKKGGRPRA